MAKFVIFEPDYGINLKRTNPETIEVDDTKIVYQLRYDNNFNPCVIVGGVLLSPKPFVNELGQKWVEVTPIRDEVLKEQISEILKKRTYCKIIKFL